MRRTGRLLATLTLAAVAMAAAPARADPSAALAAVRDRLAALDRTLAAGSAADESVGPLLARSGLSEVLGPGSAAGPRPAPPVNPEPARAELMDFRIALTLLSQSYTSENNGDVILAQGARGAIALSFRGGTVTLDTIRAALALHAPQAAMAPGQDVLRIPVLIWEDAELRLRPGDRLTLSQPDGAFLLATGRVVMEGAHLDVGGGPNPHSAAFRPFVSVGGGGALEIYGSRISGLGFGWTDKFAGLAVVGHPFIEPQGRSVLVDSRIEDVVSVVLTRAEQPLVLGNRFSHPRDNALRLRQAAHARIEGNLFHGPAPTNAIRLLDGSHEAVVAANLILGGTRTGILVAGGSDRGQVHGNLVWKREGGAIKFQDSACGQAVRNLVLDGGQKGIEVRDAPGVVLQGNVVAGNHSAGLWVSNQAPGATTLLTDNVLLRNGSGIATATGARLQIAGNDLSGQFPRLVGGDLASQNAVFVTDLRGKTPMLLTAGGASALTDDLTNPCPGEAIR